MFLVFQFELVVFGLWSISAIFVEFGVHCAANNNCISP